MDVQAIKSAVMEELRAHLAPVPLVDLEVAPDLDHDGDPILRMRAIYDDRVGTPTGEQTFEAGGAVVDLVLGLGERYPILTYISLSDYRADAA